MQIVPMKAADVDQVVSIERRSFASGWQRVHFLHEIRDNPYAFNRVLAEQGRVLGYACLWCLKDELKINNLAIHPDFRRRGLGSRLLRSVLREGRRLGCSRATLEVRPSNLPARRLYRHHGFVEVGRRRNYYALEGEDAILMNLDLSSLPPKRPKDDRTGSLGPLSRGGQRGILAKAERGPVRTAPSFRRWSGPPPARRVLMESTAEARKRLAKHDANFRRLELKHQEYDERLEELRARRYLSEEEQVEEVRLKKLKLAVKDKMEQMIRHSDE